MVSSTLFDSFQIPLQGVENGEVGKIVVGRIGWEASGT